MLKNMGPTALFSGFAIPLSVIRTFSRIARELAYHRIAIEKQNAEVQNLQ